MGQSRPTWCFWHRPVSPRPNLANKIALQFFEIARVLVRLDHGASLAGLVNDYRLFLPGGLGHGILGFFLAAFFFLDIFFGGFSFGVDYLLSAKLEQLFVVTDTGGNLVHFDFSPFELLVLINYTIAGWRAMLNVEPKGVRTRRLSGPTGLKSLKDRQCASCS